MTLAFSVGLAAAMLAWGPLNWSTTALHAGSSSLGIPGWQWAHWGRAPQVGVAALLIALALWAQFLFARCQRRVCDVAWPWRLMVLIAAVRACLWVAQSVEVSNELLAVIQFAAQLCQASLGVFLCWGLMAERFNLQCKVWVACSVGVGLLGFATIWCLLVPGGRTDLLGGDARALVLLQLMPVVLVVAGALSLSNRGLSRRESMLLIAAYLVTWFTTWLPAFSHFLTLPGRDLLIAILLWASYCALCVLALVPVSKLLQAQRTQFLGAARSERRSLTPAWLHHFRFDTLAEPNRRHNS
jgi:hypothetical protein